MYLTLALQFGETAGVTFPPDIIQITFDYQKWVQVTTILLWLAIMSVKFSFLALFKNLVNGIPSLDRYWWVATILNIGIMGYGSVVTHISCPYYYTLENVRMIWTVQVRWTQKIALTLSLCLTILMSIVTIIRGAGVYYKGLVDTNWETYWVIICAEIGVCLAAATAFRSFFIARKEYKTMSPTKDFSPKGRWYHLNGDVFRRPIVANEIPRRTEPKVTAMQSVVVESSEPRPAGITALPRLPSPYISPYPEPMASPQSSVFILD
ncbi:hypothetical protein McaMca56_005174 [Microsporum canis]